MTDSMNYGQHNQKRYGNRKLFTDFQRQVAEVLEAYLLKSRITITCSAKGQGLKVVLYSLSPDTDQLLLDATDKIYDLCGKHNDYYSLDFIVIRYFHKEIVEQFPYMLINKEE